MVSHDLEALGREAARELKSVLPLVRGDHKERNGALLEQLETQPPPLQNDSWGTLAFIAGLYASFMAKEDLTQEQRRALCLALAWAVQYEVRFRPREVLKRIRQLLAFVRQVSTPDDLRESLVDAIGAAVTQLDRKNLDWIRREVEALQSDQLVGVIDDALARVPANQSPVDTRAAADNETVAALEQLWTFLDRKHEVYNRAELDKIRHDPGVPVARVALAKLGGIILRSMLQRFVRNVELTDEALDAALRIARDVLAYSHGEFKARSNLEALIVRAIRDTRRDRLDRDAFTAVFEAAAASDPPAWSQLAWCVSLELSRRAPTEQTRETMNEWLRVFRPHWPKLDRMRQHELLEQAARHAPDSILLSELQPKAAPADDETPAERLPGMGDLLRAYKQLDLPEISRILVAIRPHLISELCRKLSDTNPGFNAILPPRRPIKMFGPRGEGGKSVDAFPEAYRLLSSNDDYSRRRGCEMFEQYAEGRIHPDFKQAATEWMLYARAQYRGLPLVFGDWQRDLKRKSASWEEIWNLAVFDSRIGDIAAALDVLRGGVETYSAPYSHLRFALYCALQIIDVGAGKTDGATVAAQRFLIQHLQLHPLPECFLLWVLLVDEAGMNVLPQQRFQVLATFQQLVDEPLLLLEPQADHPDNALDAFRKRLDELHLDKTWLIWINDFAERHPWRPVGLRKLSEALIGLRRDVDGALQRAADVLRRLVDLQAHIYQREKTRPRRELDTSSSFASEQLEKHLRNLRASVKQLFEFYKNHLPAAERTTAYRHYSSHYPFKQLWDATDPANNSIIHLTRDLIDEGTIPPPPPPPGPVGAEVNDAYILSALTAVKDVAALQALRDRLFAWMDARVQGSTIVQQRQNLVKSVVADIAALHTKTWTKAALQTEMKRVNRELGKAVEHVSAMRELRPLQAVVSASQAAFSTFAECATMQPVVRASVVPPGLPAGAPETSLVLDIENVGPGDVSDIDIVCTDSGALVTREAARIPTLSENERTTTAVPVTVVGAGSSVDCRIQMRYDSGVLADLRAEQATTVPVFDFVSRLSSVRPGAYDIPIPYTEKPIDFDRDDPRLFQGRETFVDQARSIINGQLKTDPVYYHGVRKVGKSSLLARLTVEFRSLGVVPLLIKLEGIRAAQQDIHLVINTFTSKIVDALRLSGIDGVSEPVPATSENPVVELIEFVRRVASACGSRHVALLIDEFPNLVAPNATPVLDVLRMMHQELSMSLFFSGWVRPKKLEKDCPDTQLFPLLYRAIDFLSADAVARVLREPLSDVQIDVPDATVRRAFELTAGNPHHVAALAITALNRLNAEQRVCITPDDLEYAANEVVQSDRYFRTTIFSQMILSRAERDSAIGFAKLLKGRRALPINEASQSISTEMLDDLREKGIVQAYPDQMVGIRGVLLSRYLASRIGEEPPDVPETAAKRVGVFVDVENLRDHIPVGMPWDDVARALIQHAEQFGTVVCRWAAFDKANFADPTGVRIALERGGRFLVRHPETMRSDENRKDRADFVLIERIHDELTHTKPEVVVLFSGDHGYYEVVSSLLSKDITVRLASAPDALSPDYTELESQIALRRKIDGLEGERFKVDTGLSAIFDGLRRPLERRV